MFLNDQVEERFLTERPRLELVRNESSVVDSDLDERVRYYFALEFARDCNPIYLLEYFKLL